LQSNTSSSVAAVAVAAELVAAAALAGLGLLLGTLFQRG
jgi:hypothetical protein